MKVEYQEKYIRKRHIAGIVPTTGFQNKINKNLISPLLTQITNTSTLLTRGILECACAGCDTIWVVAYNRNIKIFEEITGDVVKDPATINLPFVKDPYYYHRYIPIYYVPLKYSHEKSRDNELWSVIYGMKNANYISRKVSRWVQPYNYYISFPFTIKNPYQTLKYRTKIRHTDFMYLDRQMKGIKDGVYLPFTLRNDFLKEINSKFWFGFYNYNHLESQDRVKNKRFPIDYKPNFKDIKKMFPYDKIEYKRKKTDFSYDARDWKGLMEWYKSPYSSLWESSIDFYFPRGRFDYIK